MLELLIFFLNMLCTNPAPHEPGGECNGIHVINVTTETTDTGDETGDIKPPPPPPPSPGN